MKTVRVHQDMVAQLEGAVETLRLEAKRLADLYWAEFKKRNVQEMAKPEQDRVLGRYAPMVIKNKLNAKVYVEWRDFHPSRKGKRPAKIMAKSIKPRRGRNYSVEQFSKARAWELLLINRYEGLFQEIRDTLEPIHLNIVALNRVGRKYKWQDNLNGKQQDSEPIAPTREEILGAAMSGEVQINPLTEEAM